MKKILLVLAALYSTAAFAAVECTLNPLGLVDKIVCVPVGAGDVVTDGPSTLTSAGFIDMSAGKWIPPTTTVANLPNSVTNEGKVYWVTDAASAGDCTVGLGGGDAWCRSYGGGWGSITLAAAAGGVWGTITGTLGDQVDLASALAAKQVKAYQSVGFSATPTFTASTNNAFVITLTGNVTSSTFASPGTGQFYLFRICQDGVGGFTFTWPAGFSLAGSIQTTASGCSNQSFVWNGSAAVPIGPMFDTDVSGSAIILAGSTSGSTTLLPTAIASGTITFPAATGTVALTTGSNVATATALAANGSNCSAGQFPLGVDASGASETCTALPTTIAGTASEITASAATGAVTLSIASTLDLSGKTSTKPSKAGTSPPGTCAVGETFIDTDASAASQWLICSSTNTWTAQGAPASSTPPIGFYAAKCANGTAGPGMSLPLTLAPTPVCITGTNILSAALTFPDLAGEYSVQDRFKVPAGTSGPVNLNIKWITTSNSNSVVWQIAGVCVADDETMDPAFATAQAVTDASKTTPSEVNDAQIPALTVTSCAAGETYYFRFFRDKDHASDSVTGTTVQLLSLEFTF